MRSYIAFILFLNSHLVTVAVTLGELTLREGPSDASVTLGSRLVLRCSLDFPAGSVVQVQWARPKQGLMFGFDRSLPAFPRYQIIGDATSGNNHLQIDDVQLEDDGYFECQAKMPEIDPIRAKALLTLQVPPRDLKLEGVRVGDVREVREGNTLTVTCIASGAKPAAQLLWYKNGERIKEGVKYDEEVKGKAIDSVAKLTLQVNAEDDEAKLTCGAQHLALPSPIYANFTLAVMFPPGNPVISGPDRELRAGERIKLECQVANGNPYPEVFWYKNGRQIDKSFHNQPTVTVNDYEFTVDASDNDAKYSCRASNQVTEFPVESSLELTVYFAPEDVSIVGPTSARIGSTIDVQCSTALSHPPATIDWVVDGKPIANARQMVRQVTQRDSSGAITISNISLTLDHTNKHGCDVTCNAFNSKLFGQKGSKVHQTTTIQVQYPPESVKVYKPSEDPLLAGTTAKLTCTAKSGNPLPTLHWFKGSSRIKEGAQSLVRADIVESELEILVDASDNGARYRCEAITPALDQPIREVTNLTVYFSPAEVNIRAEPAPLRAGKMANLICESAASNPSPNIFWLRNGLRLEGINVRNKTAVYGGWQLTNKLHIPVNSGDDQATYICQAEHPNWNGKGAAIAYKLNVLYPPQFTVDSPQMASVLQNESLSLNFSAQAKPGPVEYSWTQDNTPLTMDINIDGLVVSGPTINIASVDKSHAATYTLSATNSEGTKYMKLILSVKYGAVITRLTNSVVVEEGEAVNLECYADARPVTQHMMQWTKSDSDLSHSMQSYEDGKSTLYIPSVTRSMTGIYSCNAFNGFGQAAVSHASLLVKQPPTFQHHSRFAAETGSTGRLICRAMGVPSVNLSWRKGTDPKIIKHNHRYSFVHRKVGLITHESELRISGVVESDYGRYECVAVNQLGETAKVITLDRVQAPDPPSDVQVTNITHNSVTITWEPGFDGGKQQTFSIRYSRYAGSRAQKIINVFPDDAREYTLTELKPRTQYYFSVASQNEMGFSGYHSSQNTVTTAGAAASLGLGNEEIPLVVIVLIVLVGVVLLLLNAFLVFCFIRRHKKRKLQAGSKRVTIQSPQPSPEKAASARLEPRSGVQMYSDSGLRPDSYSPQDMHQIRPKSELSEDNHSMNTVIEIDEYGNPICVQRVSPNTYHSYITDDPNEKLIAATIDYNNTYDWNTNGSRGGVAPSLPSYSDSLRSNSMQKRYNNNPNMSYAPVPQYAPEHQHYISGDPEDIPPPMGPLRTLSQELNHYAPSYQYANRNGNPMARRYSPPSSASVTLNSTPPGGSRASRNLVTTADGHVIESSPILSTFTTGAPLVKPIEFSDSDHQIQGDLV